MARLLLLLIGIHATAIIATAQNFIQVAMGQGYRQQAYYRLSDDAVTQLANESWDLAFTTIGMRDVGISVNESTTSVTGAPAPELKVYLTSAATFAELMDTSKLTTRLFNDESSWEKGALNNMANPANPFDFGWGVYNPSNNTVVGNRIFAVQLRNGAYKKFTIESLASGVYNLKYANFDGSDEKAAAIRRSDFTGSTTALFSFTSGTTLPALGAWDLVFCRYVTPLDDGLGNLLDYPVTGVLTNHGVQTASVKGVNPATVDFNHYKDSLKTRLDVIGYDWKTFGFATGWSIPNDLVYFVKTTDNQVYKIVFIDFEGASTGVSTFEKTKLGILSAVNNPHSTFAEASIYPNPVINEATVAFTLKQRQDNLQLLVRDLAGRTLWQARTAGSEGLNAITLPALNLPKGAYLLQIINGSDILTLKMMQQ